MDHKGQFSSREWIHNRNKFISMGFVSVQYNLSDRYEGFPGIKCVIFFHVASIRDARGLKCIALL